MVRGKRVDGMIVLYSKKDDPVVPYLIESGVPFVVIGKPLIEGSQITYVDNDNVQAAKEATNYMFNLGHKNVAFIGEGTEFEVGEARENGYRQALYEKNLPVEESYIESFQAGVDQGRQTIANLLGLSEPPTALVVSTDIHALIVLTALSERGIKVPNDMSLISFNNSIVSKVSYPQLTCVDTQIFQLGYEAANCLIELIDDPTMFKKSVIIPTVILEGKSCQAYL